MVIVYFGGNDSTLPNPNGLGPHVPVEEYKENMRKIAIHMKVNIRTRVTFSVLIITSTIYHVEEILPHSRNS